MRTSSPIPPLVVVTTGRQPLLARSVSQEPSPIWLASDDSGVLEAAGRPDAEWVELPADAGFARAGNTALALAQQRGIDVIVLLNDDARLSPFARSALVEAARIPGVAAAGAVLLEEDGHTIQSAGLRVTGGGGRVRALRPAKLPVGACQPAGALPGTALALRVSAALQVGGFDADRYPFYFEDVDLCLRLRRRGYRLLLVPEARAVHRGAATAGRGSRFSTYHQARGQMALCLSPAGGGPIAAALAALFSAATLLRSGDAPRSSRALALFRGMRHGLGRLPRPHDPSEEKVPC